MPGIISGAMVVATAATMVSFDAAEYIVFETIGKQIKSKGANKNMLTASQFIAQAKAKKAEVGTQTMNIVDKAVDKAKEVATSAKEAVTSVMPVAQAKYDRLAEHYAVLIAGMEQRINHLEDTVGSGATLDVEQLTDRVGQIVGLLNPPKGKKAEEAKVEVKTIQPAAPAATTNKSKPKMGGRFEAPVDWSAVPDHK